MAKTLTAFGYVKRAYKEQRFPAIFIEHISGQFYLTDVDHNLLAGPGFATQDAAAQARSKVLDRASRLIAA